KEQTIWLPLIFNGFLVRGLKGKLYQFVYKFVQESDIQNFLHVLNEMEAYTFQVNIFYFIYVLLILFAQNNVLNSRSPCSEYFLLDTTNRHNFTAKCNLTGHGHLGLHLSLRVDGCYGRQHRNPC